MVKRVKIDFGNKNKSSKSIRSKGKASSRGSNRSEMELKKRSKDLRRMLKGFFEAVNEADFEENMPFVKKKTVLLKNKAEEAGITRKQSKTMPKFKEDIVFEEVGLVAQMRREETIEHLAAQGGLSPRTPPVQVYSAFLNRQSPQIWRLGGKHQQFDENLKVRADPRKERER